MSNTGFKIYQNRRRLVNGVPDGFIEPNTTTGGVGPYIPAIYDLITCPLPITTTTTTNPNQACGTPTLISVTNNDGDLVLAFNNSGGNSVAITTEYSYDQIAWNSGTYGLISPTIIPLSSFHPGVIYFRLRSECGVDGQSGFSNIISYNYSNIPPLSVNLSRSGSQLIATISGGTPPYSYAFYCNIAGSGPCNDYNIVSPTGTTLNIATTDYSATAYQLAVYKFYCQVTDATPTVKVSNAYNQPLCLIPETLITMKDDSEKPLRDIQKGDLLYGENNEVLHKTIHTTHELYVINKGLLKTSNGHVNILEDGSLVISEDLKIGNKFVSKRGELIEIISIEIERGEFQVINISTSLETYIANGILTHNKPTC